LVSGFESNKENGIVESFLKLIQLKSNVTSLFQTPKNTNPTLNEECCNFMFNLNHAENERLKRKWIGHYIAKSPRNSGKKLSMFTPIERLSFLNKFEVSNQELIKRCREVNDIDFSNDKPSVTYKSVITRKGKEFNKEYYEKMFIQMKIPLKYWK